MLSRYDVAVVGAGPGGSAAASLLARAGLRVALLDKAHFPRDKTCGDALSPRAIHVLQQLGLGPQVEGLGYHIEGVTFVAPQGRQVRAPLSPHPSYPDHALVLRRIELDDLIRQHAIEEGAEFLGGARVQHVETHQASAEISFTRNGRQERLQARMAVIAVGASLPLLQKMELLPRRVTFSYAARAYYEGVRGLDRDIQIRFDGVPLPGYGWIFPLAPGTANVGAGFYRRSRRTPRTAAGALTAFLEHAPVAAMFADARRQGAVKGFPLRTDFHRSPVRGRRTLLVGEAAGMVNPFTGEGVDYALESGSLAAECLRACFETGDFSERALATYERKLRARFQRFFVLTHRLRQVYMNPWLLDPLVLACQRWPQTTRLLVDVMLAYRDPAQALRPGVIWKVLRSILPARRGTD